MTADPERSVSSRLAYVCLSVLLFSCTFGYLLYAAEKFHQPLREAPSWGNALPITTSSPSPLGYFRRQFLLASDIQKAYLVVSATDEVTIYVNGTLVGISRYFGARVSEILDVTRLLQPGENLLAIAVEDHASGARAELTARLEIYSADGSHQTLRTDPQWRAVQVEDYSTSRRAAWNSPRFVDLDWPAATISRPADASPIYPPRIPEKVVRTFPDGYWIGQQSVDDKHATFVRDFRVNSDRISGAWLGVSAAGNYTITLNGVLLYAYAGSLRSMELYDIGPYVNPGENRLLVHLESDVVLPKLAVSGLVELHRERLNFSTDGRWRLLQEARAHRVPAEQTSVMVMERVRESAPDANLTLDFKEIESPAGMNLVRVERYLGFALITFLAVALSLFVLHRISRHYDPIPLWQDLETLVLPLFLADILMVCLLILEQELRFDGLASFQLPLLALMAVVVLLWEGFILIERVDRRWWMDE